MYFSGDKIRHSDEELKLFKEYDGYFTSSPIPVVNKLQSFCKYVRRQDISRFLAKNELIKMQIEVPGVIIECGVYLGGGAMTFAQLASIYEPFNHTRKIVGFDTFVGFPSTTAKDHHQGGHQEKGDLSTYDGIEDEILQAVELFDKNRPLSHIPKVILVKGDAHITIPKYIENNPHTIVSMLYLDFDLYEPTKVALDVLLPRIPMGGIIAFDELNCPNFPGETLATMEVLGIRNLNLKKTPFDPWITYAII